MRRVKNVLEITDLYRRAKAASKDPLEDPWQDYVNFTMIRKMGYTHVCIEGKDYKLGPWGIIGFVDYG